LDVLFAAGSDVASFVDPDRYEDYITLWTNAVADGFIPDCVCEDGPTPSERWTPLVTTPIKSTSRRTVTPAPGGSFHISSTIPSSPTPAKAAPVPLTVLHPPAAPPTVPLDPAVKQALLSFLQGGGGGYPLPASPNAGTSSALPILHTPQSEWLSPVAQPIYDLNNFLPSTPWSAKISTPKEWLAAATQLGHAMAADPDPHDFLWGPFISYTTTTGLLFDIYQFAAVIEFNVAWRKWRRARRLPWDSSNALLRDLHLLGKPLGKAPPLKPSPSAKTGSLGAGTVGLCFAFSRPSGCPRLAQCLYRHQCSRCHTTFPTTHAACPCVGGVFAAGYTPLRG
jgi:hypothetical protein